MPKKKASIKAKGLKLYANLTSQFKKGKKPAKTRKKAEKRANLPKDPIKRFFYRLHPKRLKQYWFSKRGAKMLLKIIVGLVIALLIAFAGLYMLFRKDLDPIRPGELSRRVQSTVNTYTDRHGNVLWDDRGEGNYRLVVEGHEISTYMRQATVAIEDRDFYNHRGISISGMVRAAINNLRGGEIQGGSTLTQQLIKQVFFADEAGDRGWGGIPRKIREIILAIELERIYDKEEIITLYLNKSPYGGRRNGVESAAQTYFGKSAKDLTLAESALLAAIPNNPSIYNPYNIAGNERLIARQHKVLNDMVEVGFITQEQADEAKAVDILDQIRPEAEQYRDIEAPHFVIEVRKQLEEKLGVRVVGAGGLTIRTTLDLNAQRYAERAIADNASYMSIGRSDNVALASIDVNTGQVIAMVGSIDYWRPGFGQTNAATSLLEPGSAIKPMVGYAPLMQQRSGINYGPGTVLRDENIDSIYCRGAVGRCQVRNFSGRFYGDVTIRQSLAGSLNIPAIKATYIAGLDESIRLTREMGAHSYCRDNNHAGLSAAIGGGCSVRLVELTNAYATLARGGTYRPISYILEVTDNSGETLMEWEEDEGREVVDPQVAYLLGDIMHDPMARAELVWGAASHSFGFVVPGVWTATKTGTTDNGAGLSKDQWVMSYSTAISTGVWSGNHDGSPMLGHDNTHIFGRRVVNDFMMNVHNNVYARDGRWSPGDTPERPRGIQRLTINGRTDLWPSWYNRNQTGATRTTMTFDRISRKRAHRCTPEAARVDVEVTRIIDPVTRRESFIVDGDWDPTAESDVHSCNDRMPNATISFDSDNGPGTPTVIRINFVRGTFALREYTLSVGGRVIARGQASSNTLNVTHTFTSSGQTVTLRITDAGLYENTITATSP